MMKIRFTKTVYGQTFDNIGGRVVTNAENYVNSLLCGVIAVRDGFLGERGDLGPWV